MREVVRIFLRAPGARPISVLVCLLLAGVFSLISFGAILPVITIAGGINVGKPSKLYQIIQELFGLLGFNPTLSNLLLFLLVSLSLKAVLSFAAMSYVAVAMAEVSTRVRKMLVSAMLRVRWSYYLDNPPATMGYAISGEATAAAATYNAAAATVAEGVKFAVALVVAMLLSGTFFGVAMLGAACVGLPITWLIRTSRRNRKRQFKYTSKLVDNAQDVFSNIKALRAMQRQGTFELLFDRTIRDLRHSLVKHQITRHALSYGQDLLIAVAICTGIFAGAVLYQVPLPELLVLGIVFTQIIGCIKAMQGNYQLFLENVHGYRFCLNVIVQARDLEEQDLGSAMPTLQNGCRFEQVSFGFGHTPILDEVSLEISARGITVLSGPSGAGKTTIVDLLVGFHQPTKGQILVDGIPLSQIRLQDWRRGIGYVPQELTLLHGSITENVTMGDSSISQDAVTQALAQAGALAFVSNLPQGLETDVGQMGSKLSGGERQRISLARALVLKPRLLILDEVTSALDENTEAAICASVRELSRYYTVVAITHRPAWTNIADRLYRVRGGKVARIGSQLHETEM